jgi:16S rRNA (uracil1498-N3)-methyltransferase
MARRRFFVPEIRRGTAELSGSDAEHLVRVLRAEAGQIYELSDNQRLYLAQIETARKSLVSFRVLEELSPPAASVSITLLPALFKFDRFEWLIEKATELGVNTIQPWEAIRTEHGLAKAAIKRAERWQRIALEASQQSRRVHLPHIAPVLSLRKVVLSDAPLKLLLDEDASAPPIAQVLPERAAAAALISGPEGGWTAEEKELCLAAGWQPCSLGETVLRAETAAMAALAITRGALARRAS